MSALRELIAFFGVEVDDKKLDHAGEKMEGLARLAERVGATIGLAFGLHEIFEFTKGQVEMGAELLHTSEILGLGVEELQAFQYAARNAGLGADEANTALRFLNKNVGLAIEGGGDGAAVFAKLGVKLKDASGHARDTKDILADVADGFEKLHSPQEKTAKAMEIFGRAGARMIPLLNKGSKGIDEFYEEFKKLGGGIDKEFVEAAEEGEHQMNKLNLAWKAGKATIAAALLPAFTWLVSEATDAVHWFMALSKHSYIVKTALGTLAVIVGALALVWAFLNIEVLLVVLAIVALILVVDDIYTMFQGGKSVIGDFVDSLFGIGSTAEGVALLHGVITHLSTAIDEARPLWDALGEAVRALGDAFGISLPQGSGFLRFLRDEFVAGVHAAIDVLETIIDVMTRVTKAFTGVMDLTKEIGGAGAVGLGEKLLRAAAGAHGGTQWENAPAGHAQGSVPSYTPPAMAGAAGAVMHTGDVVNHTEIKVDVKTTGSPKETGKEVADGVRQGVSTLNTDLQGAYAGLPGNGGS